ncbi:UNVERIFIED_CONTAM: hypothetical protein Cloal_3216 [Acetivibrio alkalicellulosi]
MIKPLFIVLIFFLVLNGCTSNSKEEKNITKDDFTVILSSDKDTYKSTDDVIITAKLKYTGEKDKIEIIHAFSPFSFGVKETNTNIYFPPVVLSVKRERVLIRDEWYEETYNKLYAEIGFIDDKIVGLEEINKEFTEEFKKGKTFPPGNYLITLKTEFEINGIEYEFSDSIEIVVED